MKCRVLFLCLSGCNRSQMAVAFARSLAPPDAVLASAALREPGLDPLVKEVLADVGVDLGHQPCLALAQMPATEFDVVVVLTENPAAELPLLPGHPAVVPWCLPDPSVFPTEPQERRAAFVRVRDRIRQLVEDFFGQGYLQAFLGLRRTESLILDGISDGLMAHDLDQRIVFLNQAAERITGVRREQALGRSCRDIFGTRFCGSHCVLEAPQTFDERRQRVVFLTPAGERRVLDVRLRPLQDRRTGKPVGVVVSFHDVTREHELEQRIGEVQSFSGIVGRDPKMQAVYDLIRDLAEANVPVMIQGESGTGKELVAAAIHNEGPRADRPFVAVNCGALPEGLLESELFGHVRGSFTGAIRDKKGRFEVADGGTIFLDEVGDITPAMQVRLLRVLQDGVIQRVGSESPVRVDVRIISATHRDLRKEIEAGRFREDLYYRLNVVPILLPPLRERVVDIPLLAEHLLERFRKQMGREQPLRIGTAALDMMLTHTWPGNVREMQNWLQYALVKCHGEEILPAHLPTHLFAAPAPAPAVPAPEVAAAAPAAVRGPLTPERVEAALARAGGSRVAAARLLGVSRATLYRYFDAHAAPQQKEPAT
jgi:PAS domain S-box-containing protein